MTEQMKPGQEGVARVVEVSHPLWPFEVWINKYLISSHTNISEAESQCRSINESIFPLLTKRAQAIEEGARRQSELEALRAVVKAGDRIVEAYMGERIDHGMDAAITGYFLAKKSIPKPEGGEGKMNPCKRCGERHWETYDQIGGKGK